MPSVPWKVRHACMYSNTLTWSSAALIWQNLSWLTCFFLPLFWFVQQACTKHPNMLWSLPFQQLHMTFTLFGLLGGLPKGYDNTNRYPVNEVIHANQDDDNHKNDLNHGGMDYPDPDYQCHLVQVYMADYLESIIYSWGVLLVEQQLVPQSFSVTSLCASASLHDMNGNVRLAINSKNQLGFALDLAQHCLAFLHVPHVKIFKIKTTTNTTDGCKTSHLLNAPYCLFVTFHHITQWLGYQEHEFHGKKFKLKQQKRSGKWLFR